MSYWTEVLLTVSSHEDAGTSKCPVWRCIDFINCWLRDRYNGLEWPLFEVWAPDDRHCPLGIFVGHFKSIGTASFIEAVRQAPWERKELVRLFIRDENEEVFTLREIFP